MTGRLEYNHEMERELDLAPGLAVGATFLSALGSSFLSMDYDHFTGGADRTRYALGHNAPLVTDLALRIGIERREAGTGHIDEAIVSLRYYF
jgi:hypothetical protein